MIRKSVLVVLVILAAWALIAEAQFGGRGRGGGYGRRGGGARGNPEMFQKMMVKMEAISVLDVEPMWAALSFGTGLTPEQLDPLRGSFAQAWKQRMEILEDSRNGEDRNWGAIKDEFKDVKKDLEKQVKKFLNKDQRKAYSKLMKTYKGAIPEIGRGMRR